MLEATGSYHDRSIPALEGEGGGKSRQPKEYPDSLFSNNIAKIIDLLSEGEIEGLVDGDKGILYNEVPWEGEGGEKNFTGVVVYANYGTPDQPAIPGFDDTRTTVAVAQELPYNVYKTISFPNDGSITSVVVTIAASNFFEVNKDGDTTGTNVSFVIEVSENGSAFQAAYSGTISGKQQDEVTFDYRVPINVPAGQTAVRVKRTTSDATSLKVNNDITFKNYTRVVEHKFNYPNVAYVGHIVDAKQFGNKLPTRQYRARGIKCRVPHNYDPVTRTYTGPFNGTLTATKVYTNNPAWIYYELVTNKRFGLGQFVDASLNDIPTLYQVGKWSDDLVPDGIGGTEPRWVCNAYINTRGEAYNLLKELVSCFRGNLFWMQAKVWALGDQPRDPVKIVTNANVIDGKFSYSGESNKNRFSVINVAFNDPDLLYRRGIETVEDPGLCRELGYKPKDFGAFGCTSRGQARRLGKALLFSQEFESELVSYTASFDHMSTFGDGPDGVAPGDLILISDRERGNARSGGRIKSVVGNVITVDREIETAGNGTIYVEHTNGQVEWLTCTFLANGTVTLTQAPVQQVAPNDLFILLDAGFEPEPFVVLRIKEDGPNKIEVTAVRYDEGRYAAIYGEQNIDAARYMSLPDIRTVQPPTGPLVFEDKYITGADLTTRVLEVSFGRSPDTLLSHYRIRWSKDFDDWNELPLSSSPTGKIFTSRAGLYRVQVTAVSRTGLESQTIYGEYTVEAVPSTDTLALGVVENLALQTGGFAFSGKDAKVKWTIKTPQGDYLTDVGVSGSNTGLVDPNFRDCVVTVRRKASLIRSTIIRSRRTLSIRADHLSGISK
jgi:predicted phage tail protein